MSESATFIIHLIVPADQAGRVSLAFDQGLLQETADQAAEYVVSPIHFTAVLVYDPTGDPHSGVTA